MFIKGNCKFERSIFDLEELPETTPLGVNTFGKLK
jgi:hypothetical protein